MFEDFNYSSNHTAPSWMQYIPDNTLLNQINIPGTHQSATYKIKSLGEKCQELSVYGQLNDGIRALDIHLQQRDEYLKLYHGVIPCRLDFHDILKECQLFLSENPSETIYMFVTEEKSLPIARTFLEYIHQYHGLYYRGSTNTTLNNVRGKIVFFLKFPIKTENLGISIYPGWSENQTFFLKNKHNQHFLIQDEYKHLDPHKKAKKVELMIDTSSKITGNNLFFINYCNIRNHDHYEYLTPNLFARGQTDKKKQQFVDIHFTINEFLEQYLEQLPRNSHLGMMMLDFYNKNLDERTSLINKIIKFNFYH
nr:phosphatidylinositol-specific phospholipase C domain-containing protein [Acinetobacter sp. Marseille-Q1620]